MNPNLKSILNGLGKVLLWCCGFVLLAVFWIALIRGGAWLSERILPFLIVIDVWLAYGCFLILLPMCIFSPLRNFAGTCLFMVSYVFGLSSMAMALLFTYAIWGIFGVLIGLAFFGAGIVPLSLLATAIAGQWTEFWFVFITSIGGIICRMVAVYVVTKQKEEMGRKAVEEVLQNNLVEVATPKPNYPFYKTTSAWLRHVRANQPKQTVEGMRQQVRDVMGEDFKVNPPYKPKE